MPTLDHLTKRPRPPTQLWSQAHCRIFGLRRRSKKAFRESGYSVVLRCHRHFAVADAWGQRGEKIGKSQASRKCCGPTRSLIDASRAVALVWCLGGFRESEEAKRRLDSPNGAKRGPLAPKVPMTKAALLDSARLIRQDVLCFSFGLRVDPWGGHAQLQCLW